MSLAEGIMENDAANRSRRQLIAGDQLAIPIF
jgi:hypothetical protein